MKNAEIANLKSSATKTIYNYSSVPGLICRQIGSENVRLLESTRAMMAYTDPRSKPSGRQILVLDGILFIARYTEDQKGDEYAVTRVDDRKVQPNRSGATNEGVARYATEITRHTSGEWLSIDADEIVSMTLVKGTVALIISQPAGGFSWHFLEAYECRQRVPTIAVENKWNNLIEDPNAATFFIKENQLEDEK